MHTEGRPEMMHNNVVISLNTDHGSLIDSLQSTDEQTIIIRARPQ